jgi:hypothetical protein
MFGGDVISREAANWKGYGVLAVSDIARCGSCGLIVCRSRLD